MNIQDILTSDEPSSIDRAYFCLGLGYLGGHGNSVSIRFISDAYKLKKLEKNSNDAELSSKMFAVGLCWLYDKTVPKI